MKLTKIEIDNLYGYINYSINLLDQTFLVGINGTGKSSILRIIDAFFSKKISFFHNLNFKKISLFFEQNKEEFYIELKKRKEKKTIQRENEIEIIETESCMISDSRMNSYMKNFYNERKKNLLSHLDDKITEENNNLKKELEEINKNLENIFNIKFTTPFSIKDYYDRFMKEEDIKFLSNGIQYIDDRKKYLSSIINKNISFSEAENTIKELEDILDPMNTVKKLWEKAIKEYLESLLDGKTEFILNDYVHTINKFFKDTGKEMKLEKNEIKIKPIGHSVNINLDELSSGEMELLILFTKIFFSFNQNSIVIFDEPEKSLHIEWQILLGEFFKVFSEKHKDSQLIIATHSPFITQEINDINIIPVYKLLNMDYTVENKGDL